jgi:hypothetical protein
VTGSGKNTLPQWTRVAILAVLAAVFVYNVQSGGDAALSLLIAGGLLAAVGLDLNARNGGGQ